MKALTTRTRLVAAATLLQLALVPVAVAGPLSARLTGDEYLLAVAPVDPIDPFRGAYVALSYPGLQDVDSTETGEDLEAIDDTDDTVYVPLVRSGAVWTGGDVVAKRPARGPYLRCTNDWQLRCGIESWFLPQDKALALERAVGAGDAVARIRVDSRGNAALVDVEIRERT